MKMYTHFVLSLLATLAAGCASNSIPDQDPVTEPAAADAGTDGYMSDGHSGGELLVGNTSSELGTVIYFDYDQAELKPEYLDLLARHAARLSAGGSMEIRLEGHADERGSREYNIGLGERRSQSVRRVLIADGVPAAQLSTISFGEERPAVRGSDEQSYSQNRRVVIHYMN